MNNENQIKLQLTRGEFAIILLALRDRTEKCVALGDNNLSQQTGALLCALIKKEVAK
jgi:hypothetical protein